MLFDIGAHRAGPLLRRLPPETLDLNQVRLRLELHFDDSLSEIGMLLDEGVQLRRLHCRTKPARGLHRDSKPGLLDLFDAALSIPTPFAKLIPILVPGIVLEVPGALRVLRASVIADGFLDLET